MLPLLAALAIAATPSAADSPIEAAMVRPPSSWLFARLPPTVTEDQARKLLRKRGRSGGRTPAETAALADALQVVRDATLVELAGRMELGEDVDFGEIDRLDREARALYLDAAPGLPDREAARALFAAGVIGFDLGLSPIPEFETSIELDPMGPYAAQARLGLAEQAFDRADLKAAMVGYAAVAAAEGKLAPYARYKLAWCQYNLGELGSAVDQMVALARGQGPLSTEAHNDAVLFAGTFERPEALTVVDRLCGADTSCAEASALRLEQYWTDVGRRTSGPE